MGHSIYETRPHIQREYASNSIPTERVETIKPLEEYVSKLPIILALLGLWRLSTSHIPIIYLPNPTRFGSSHPTSKYCDSISQIQQMEVSLALTCDPGVPNRNTSSYFRWSRCPNISGFNLQDAMYQRISHKKLLVCMIEMYTTGLVIFLFGTGRVLKASNLEVWEH